MSTYFEKNIDQNKKNWYLFDAKDQVLGRLATQIARVLRGKHKPTFTKHVDAGDFAVVINADKIALTGEKWTDKKYFDHSGYTSGLRIRSAREVVEGANPDDLIRRAVWGMLDKNKLGRAQMTKLKVYAKAEHPHKAQKVVPYTEPKRTVARPTGPNKKTTAAKAK
ncbi:MAG: 50S ribosomal protein L13 [Deltaproteobacteria bacterium]|nr:50S ribosomal protein L13 [Deltaproteobacteria bacterium]